MGDNALELKHGDFVRLKPDLESSTRGYSRARVYKVFVTPEGEAHVCDDAGNVRDALVWWLEKVPDEESEAAPSPERDIFTLLRDTIADLDARDWTAPAAFVKFLAAHYSVSV